MNTTETEAVEAPARCRTCDIPGHPIGTDGFCDDCREDDAAAKLEDAEPVAEPGDGPNAEPTDQDAEDERYPWHPRAARFPAYPQAKFEALVESIRTHGQQQPIEVQMGPKPRGGIPRMYLLDGRHRLKACRQLDIDPDYRCIKIADDQVPLYTATKAAQRDGLTATQKVLIALALMPGLQVGPGKRRADAAATAVGVSGAYVERGIELRSKAPELFERVKTGELGLSEAHREYRGVEKPEPTDDDDRFRVPEQLRPRLAEIMEAIGGETLGDAVEALLDFAESDPERWARWAAERRGSR